MDINQYYLWSNNKVAEEEQQHFAISRVLYLRNLSTYMTSLVPIHLSLLFICLTECPPDESIK